MRKQHDQVVTIFGANVGQSAKAVKFILDKKQYPTVKTELLTNWFPFSQVVKISDTSLVVSKWILDQKGLYESVTTLAVSPSSSDCDDAEIDNSDEWSNYPDEDSVPVTEADRSGCDDIDSF